MIPILFDENVTEFNNNGLGRLAEACSCAVTEERNGTYELEMKYPVSGKRYGEIKLSRIIFATPSDGADEQAFRIYKITKPLNGIVTVYAEHISYQLSYIPVMPFSAESASAVLSNFDTASLEDNPFSFWTDRVSSGKFSFHVPASCRSLLGGTEGSVLDVYGGEYEWDNYIVKLHNSRGQDRGVTLRYGKNITSIEQEEYISNTITGIVPYYKSDDTLVVLPEKAVYADNAGNYPYKRTAVKDFSSDFEEVPTEAQLRQAAQSYIKASGVGVPKVSLTVEFVPLWQTEEYKNIATLERVKLCDTVTVIFEKLDVKASAKVIATTYDVLKDRYSKIELGEAKSSLATTISDQSQDVAYVKSESFLEKAVKRATDAINFAENGYVIMPRDADGNINELLIMDKPNKETATKVWRWNMGGLGYSSSGYNGPYGTAITMDGAIVANYITVGTMSCDRIRGGTLILGGASNGNGTFYLRDAGNQNIAIMDNTGLKMYKGSINLADKFIVSSEGKLQATDATITGSITANTGYIGGTGGFVIAAGKLYSGGKTALGYNSDGVYLGVEGIALGQVENGVSMFEVDKAGTAVMRKAYVIGNGLLFEPGGGISTDYSSYAQFQVLSNGKDVMVNAVDGNLMLGPYNTYGVHCGATLYDENGREVKGTTASDRRLKRSIRSLDKEKAYGFILHLAPAEYRYRRNAVKKDFDRYHHGFIAQDLKNAMYADWAVVDEFDLPGKKKQKRYCLEYDELLADMVAAFQYLSERVDDLYGKTSNSYA